MESFLQHACTYISHLPLSLAQEIEELVAFSAACVGYI